MHSQIQQTEIAIRSRTKHGISIAILMLIALFLMYIGYIPWNGSMYLGDFFTGGIYYETCLLFIIISVIYASFIFRIRGGIIVALINSAALLPLHFLLLPDIQDSFRLLSFTVIELLVAGLIGSNLNNRERLLKEHDLLQKFVSDTVQTQELEKKHLAHELHDATLQNMVDISHEIDELITPNNDPVETENRLKQLRSNITKVIEGTRRFVTGLRPPLLEELGLIASLNWLVEELRESDIEVNVDMPSEEKKLPDIIELSIFRIAQEALNNARKHSKATKIEMKFSLNIDKVKLKIADNGIGFLMPESNKLAREGRFGLIGMMERAQIVGGSLHIESANGKGCSITVEMPILGA